MEKQSTHENQKNLHVCKVASSLAYDICLEAVKEHGHSLFVSDYNRSQCRYYAEKLTTRCYEALPFSHEAGRKLMKRFD